MKVSRKISALGLLLLAGAAALNSVPAYAGAGPGLVGSLYARSSDGLQIVQLSGGSISGRPPCASSTTYYAIKDENSRAGQAQFAQLLSAQLAGRTVVIEGTGACTRWFDAEDILFVQIQP